MKKLLLTFIFTLILTIGLVSATAVLQNPVNNSMQSSTTILFNISGENANTGVKYNFTIGYSNGTVTSGINLVNDTLTHYWNSTTLEIDAGYGLVHNWTLYENATLQWVGFFDVDSTAPTIAGTPTFALGNKTTGGNYLNVTFNITDINPSQCRVRLYYQDGTIINMSGEISYNSTPQWAYCYANVTPSEINKDGYVEVVPATKDEAGNEAISTTNQSWIVYRLKTGWNFITGFENKTLSQIAGEFTNVTYVSVWDNTGTMKNFTTFTLGGSTNANVRSNLTSIYGYGSAYIYVSTDIVSMRRYYTPITSWLNATLFRNTTTGKTSWNQIGVTKRTTDLNATIMANACFNSTHYTGSCEDITWVSWYNIQLGKYCSFYRNRLATSCSGYLSNNITLERGDSLWIALSTSIAYNNITLDRGKW